jgi:hypothetical protein
MNNPYLIVIMGFVLMSFSAGWLGLATVLGIPGISYIGAFGVILFCTGLGIVIPVLSKLKSIEVRVVDE